MKSAPYGATSDGSTRPDSSPLVERRTLLRGLATGLAGTVAVPSLANAAGTPSTSSADHTAVHPSQAPVSSSSATAPAQLLDDHQRRTLTSLAEMLVPGSAMAGVVDLIDRVAAVDAPPRQRQFLNALGAFEHQARSAHGVRWVDLDQSTRLAILQAASTGPEARPLPPPWTKGQPLAFAPAGPPAPATLRDHFELLRTVVANAYFATEPGMKEHGWTGRTGWKELPGCDHAEGEHQ